VKLIAKMDDFSIYLKKAFGTHVQISKAYNEQAIMVQKSIKKINDYKTRQ
jgi:hypothetical protein